jgi:hypothetical protein
MTRHVSCFTLLQNSDLPQEWRVAPTAQWVAEQARLLELAVRDVFTTVVFEVPDTPMGHQYLRWFHGVEGNRLCVPPMLVSLSDFIGARGPEVIREFDLSIRTIGRPCHIVRLCGKRP